MSDDHKAKGNAAFTSGKFEEAIKHYSEGITVDPRNHVLYSNRSACQASLGNWDEALSDAEKCVEIKPDFVKGYSRLGGAYFGLKDYEQASTAYNKGLELDPSNSACTTGLKNVADASKPSPAAGGLFGPDFIAKLAMNPETRRYMEQPDFLSMVQDLSANPGNLQKYLGDPRFQKALEVSMGISLGGMGGAPPPPGGPPADAEAAPPSPPAAPPKPKPPSEPQPTTVEEVEMTEEEQAEAASKAKALEKKAEGAAAYKAKDFDAAISHFTAALELYSRDVSFLTNRAAAYFEKGDYELAIADCQDAVEKGRQIMPVDFKMISRAMTRHGSALVRQGKLQDAIKMFNHALTEHRNPDSLRLLQAAEKRLRDEAEAAYIDLDRAEQAKNEGNECFKAAQYPKAIEHYTEALKRGPPEKWGEAFKCYSNRAACYTKLGALPEGEKDADRCIELNPQFAKGYSRKAHVQFLMKESEKALETYEKGLVYEPDNQELKEGVQRCRMQINRFMTGMASEDEIKERQAKAMSDPEIQNIMMDPVMQQVLKECQETPGSLSQHLKNSGIAGKLQKLMAAGIIRMA